MLKIRLVNPDLPEDAYIIGFTQEDMDNFAKIFKNAIESEYGEPAKLTKNKVKQYISSFFFNYSIPSEKRDKLDFMLVEIPKPFSNNFCDYLFIASQFDMDFEIPNCIINCVLTEKRKIGWSEMDSGKIFNWLAKKENIPNILKYIEIADETMPENKADDEYYFEEDYVEDCKMSTDSYIYKLPNLATLLHIPACRGQVFEGYDHRYYLESEQFLQDFLDEAKYPIAKYQVKIKDMEDFYQQIPKDVEQIEID